MGEILLRCTNHSCNTALAFSERLMGTIQKCPNCGQKIFVPDEVAQITKEFTQPSIEKPIQSEKKQYEIYGKIEDIAGVDYKIAYIITAMFILAHFVLPSSFFYGFIGSFSIFIVPIVIWRYFKLFFKSIGDHIAARFVNYIIFSYVTYFLVVGLITVIVNDDMQFSSMLEIILEALKSIISSNYEPRFPKTEKYFTFVGITGILLIISFVLTWVAGIKLIRRQRLHSFPLKRIAWSSMICIPLSIITLLVNNEYASNGIIWEIFLLLPYIFLFIHFYKADNYDLTPS